MLDCSTQMDSDFGAICRQITKLILISISRDVFPNKTCTNVLCELRLHRKQVSAGEGLNLFSKMAPTSFGSLLRAAVDYFVLRTCVCSLFYKKQQQQKTKKTKNGELG